MDGRFLEKGKDQRQGSAGGSFDGFRPFSYDDSGQDTGGGGRDGEPMVNFTDEAIGNAQGRIALQIHDGGGIKVQWKDLTIQPL